MDKPTEERHYEPRSYPCVICNKRTKQKERRTVNGDQNKNFRKYLFKTYMINTKENDVSCSKCRSIYYRRTSFSAVGQNDKVDDDPVYIPPCKKQNVAFSSPRNITLPLSSVKGPSHSSCCVCKRRGHKFVVVPSEVRYNVLMEKNIIIPVGSRCCPGHIEQDRLTKESQDMLSDLKTETQFNRSDIYKLIQQIREIAQKSQSKRIDFDSDMNDSDYYNLIGINKEAFDNICEHIQDIRTTKVRSQRTCIGILLTKLRSGMSNRLLSTVFNMGIDSIKRSVSSARKALSKDFTPHYIGFEHISRQNIIDNHTRNLAKTLFGNYQQPAILVIDGTYIYIQKSSKFSFQRRSFSMHKKRPLVKPMMIVSTTGYFISILGPYLSDYKNNDANIIKHALSSNIEKMRDWLQDGDIVIVDRGFRDSIDFLNELGIKTEMPAFLNKGKKQHTVEESNSSRLVTKIRWIVESANGRMKLWKYLSNIVPNSQIPYISDYTRLVGAISNKYLKPLCASEDSDDTVGCRLLHLAKQSNQLMERVLQEGLDKQRIIWKSIDSSDDSIADFPILEEDELRNITLGVYQLKLAKSYTDEHENDEGGYDIFINKQENELLMAKIQSRHVSNKVYKLWISYDEIIIKGWYCQCRSGARVVGTCAHIAAVIWYLGFARHRNVPFDTNTDWTAYLKDASNMPEPELIDNDSDENDCIEE